MLTIRNNPYNEGETLALHDALNAAVTHFINQYCDPKEKCQVCKYRHVCYDIIQARDYAYKVATGGAEK